MNVVLLSETADHEQTEEARRRLIEFWWVGHTFVQDCKVFRVDAEAVVLDLELDRGVRLDCGERNGRCRIRELRCVVEKLSEHVGDVGNNSATHVELWQVANLDTLEVLNLSERRTNNVIEGHWALPLTWRTVAGQHEKRFSVTTHSGCKVIELVQTTEGVWVLLVSLKIRDHGDHAVVELLVSSAEANEHLGHVTA